MINRGPGFSRPNIALLPLLTIPSGVALAFTSVIIASRDSWLPYGIIGGLAIFAVSAIWIRWPAVVVLAIPLFSLTAGILNPLLVSRETESIASLLKWVGVVVPVTVVLALRAEAQRSLLRFSSRSALIFGAFVAWSLLVTLFQSGLDRDMVAKWLSLLLLYLLSFVAAPVIVRNQLGIRNMLRGLHWFALFVMCGSLVMLIVHPNEALVLGRLAGLVFNATALAMILGMGVLVSLTIALEARHTATRVWFYAFAVAEFGVLVLTGVRSMIVSVLIGLVALGVGAWKLSKVRFMTLLIIGILMPVAVVTAFVSAFGIDLARGVLRERGGEEVRLLLLRNTYSVVEQNPGTLITGIGYGAVRKTYYARLGWIPEDELTQLYGDYFFKLLHNSYIEVLLETGIPGLLLIMWALASGIWATARLAVISSPRQAVTYYGVLAILLTSATFNLASSSLLAPGGVLAVWNWVLLGVSSRLAIAEI